jgi:integrase
MSLTDVRIRNTKSSSKPVRLFDGGGLYLEIMPSGGKLWRYKYRFGGKEKRIALGTYPEISLKDARARHTEARKQLANDIDPSAIKKAVKASTSGADCFEAVAREWHDKFSPSWSESHRKKLLGRLVLYLFPWLGKRPVNEITAPELLMVIRKIEVKGHLETAHRTLELCGQVLRFAVQTGRMERNCAGDLKGAIPPAASKRMAAITDPVKIGHLLEAIDSYSGAYITRCALQLAPLFFLRPGELRKAEWSEFDLARAEWRIAIGRMKRSQQDKEARRGEVAHIVPLSRQALAILNDLKLLTGSTRFLFPGLRSKDRPISDATLTNALRRMGYTGDEATVHGFRHMASTRLHEMGFPSHLIEKQLSHGDRNRIRAVYNHAEYLPERRNMMQVWADYLDSLKSEKRISLAEEITEIG